MKKKVYIYVGVMLALIVGSFAWINRQKEETKAQVYIYKVDVDAEPEIAAAYGIQSIPTLFFCPMNGTPQMSQGAMQKEDFKKMITDVLLKK